MCVCMSGWVDGWMDRHKHTYIHTYMHNVKELAQEIMEAGKSKIHTKGADRLEVKVQLKSKSHLL